MSASRIRKILNPQLKRKLIAKIGLSNKCTRIVHNSQCISADRYQQLTLDSAALLVIDKAWLDARESSKMDPDTVEKINKIGQKYSESTITNSTVNTDMVIINGFYKN